MSSHSLTLRQKLHEFTLSWRRLVGALTLVRALWVAVLGVLTLVYADLLLILPAPVRMGVSGVFILTLIVVAVVTFRRHTRTASEDRLVARLVEQSTPDLHNDLINAVDFEEALAGEVHPGVSRDLMGHEIMVASDKVSRILHVDTLRPPSLRGELRILAGELIVFAVLAFVFVEVFAAILPRYLDPAGDHPPYSPTRLAVEPANATVEYGANQIIHVTATGKKPKQMLLVLTESDGRTVSTLPMLDGGEGTYFQTIENIHTNLVYYAEIPRSRSKRYTLSLSKTPRIDSVAVTYTYPEYTHLPPKSRLLSKNDATLTAYAGTNVNLDLTSNRPLQGGPVEVNGKTLALTRSDDEATASVAFPLEQTGTIWARLVDVEGIESTDTFTGKIEIMPDKRPEVTVVSPGKHSFAIPDAQVPIVIEARDDLGIENIALFRSHNGSKDDRKNLYDGAGTEIFTSVTELLDFADLGVRPGDVIEYYATATDTLPDSPQTASTPAFQIAIISFEAYRDFMQKQLTAEDLKNKYDQILEKIEALAKTQETLEALTRDLEQKLAESGALSEEEQKLLEKAQEQQATLAKDAGDLAEELQQAARQPAIFDIEKEYKKSLQEFARRLEDAQEHMQAGRADMENARSASEGNAGRESLQQARRHQKDAMEQLGKSAEQFKEQIQQANEDLARVYKLLNDVEQFKQLYRAQQMLERQARTYKDLQTPDLDEQIRLKELAEAQDAIRENLGQLQEQLREHAAEIEADYPQVAQDARDIADGIETRQIPGLMEGASEKLSASNAPDGHADARAALEALESMIAFCQAAQGQGSQQCELRLKIQMALNPGNTLGQLAQSLGAPGLGQGFGMGGQGGGMASSAVPFDVYGSDAFGNPRDPEHSSISRRQVNAQAQPEPSESLAGSFEELATAKNEDFQVDVDGGERVVEEYRPLIEAYFRGLAGEE